MYSMTSLQAGARFESRLAPVGPGPDGTLSLVRELVARARRLSDAADDRSWMEEVASIARDLLGYDQCAVVLRLEDGRACYRAGGEQGWAETDADAPGPGNLPEGWVADSVLWAPMTATDGTDLGLIGVNGDDGTRGDGVGELLVGMLAELAGLSQQLRRAEVSRLRAAALADAQRRQLEDLVAASLEGGGGLAPEESAIDKLTGLLNRRAFLERAGRVVRSSLTSGAGCATLYVDIDNFKDVNDSFGHGVGDEVITAVARIMAHRLRKGDLLGRYGGDEFIVLLRGTGLDEAVQLAEEIRELVATSEPIQVNPPVHPRISVGVAGLRPADDPESLLAAARVAMCHAKSSGRDRVCVASAERN